jgi:hypothetical protein
MQPTPSETEDNRFVVLVTWRRDHAASDQAKPCWRGFASRLEKDGGVLPPIWFQKLDDLGVTVRRLLPPHAQDQDIAL